jgi:hypothetical protein
MKKCRLVAYMIWAISTITSISAYAQISITSQNYASQKGKSYNYTNYQIELSGQNTALMSAVQNIIAQKGENKTFDFRNLPFPSAPSYTSSARFLKDGDSHPFMNETATKDAN